MIKTKNKVIGSGLLFILLLALFFTFWTIQYHNVAIHAQIHIGKENHLPSTAISIVGVRLLGSERYLNFFGIKDWSINYHISGRYYPANEANFITVTQWPNGEYTYVQPNI